MSEQKIKHIIGIFSITLWLITSMPAFKAEGLVWKQIFSSKESAFKAFSVDWPLYDFLNKTCSMVSEESALYYFNSIGGEGGTKYSALLKYYLYPRKVVVVNPGDEVKMADILKSDYILFYMPHGFKATGVESAISNIPVARLIYKSDADAYQAIYGIEKTGIK